MFGCILRKSKGWLTKQLLITITDQISTIKSLLAGNEKAIEELERVSQAAANWRTSSSVTNLNETVKNLKELVESAVKYKF